MSQNSPLVTNLQTCPCEPSNCPPKPFIFDNVQYQNSANTVYERQQSYNRAKNARVTGKTYKFKTDYERMQALTGCLAAGTTALQQQ